MDRLVASASATYSLRRTCLHEWYGNAGRAQSTVRRTTYLTLKAGWKRHDYLFPLGETGSRDLPSRTAYVLGYLPYLCSRAIAAGAWFGRRRNDEAPREPREQI